MRPRLLSLFLLAAVGCSSREAPPASNQSLDDSISEAMSGARAALAEHGETVAAIEKIQAILAKLARHPDLRGRVPAGDVHGNQSTRAEVLASDGENALTLVFVRFKAGSQTPVHDHLTWGVACVVEGEDRYTAWERTDDGSDPAKATLRQTKDLTMKAGDTAFWLGPPHDLHRQAPVGGDATELVMAGKNLLGPAVLEHRHNFDPQTGKISHPGKR